MMINPGNWEMTEEEIVAWYDDAWPKLTEEVQCLAEHWEAMKVADILDDHDAYERESFMAAKHAENLTKATTHIWHMFVKQTCREGVIMQLSVEKAEQLFGGPVEIVGLGEVDGGAAYLFHRKDIVVPDDASELDGNGYDG